MAFSRLALACMFTVFHPSCVMPSPPDRVLTVPFDNHRNQVAVVAMLQGEPLNFLIDTAVTPSVIDLATAERLGLPINRSNAGEAQGVGTNSASVYRSELRGMTIQGREIEPTSALAFNMAGLSERYGKPLHGILGQSFLEGRTLLIDYLGDIVYLLEDKKDAEVFLRGCRLTHRLPLTRYQKTTTPVVEINVGGKRMPATLDTGGSYSIEFMKGALPDEIAAVAAVGKEVRVTGARGDAKQTEFVLPIPVQFGPFRFDNVVVAVSDRPGSPETRQANIGNALLHDFKLLLDYRTDAIGLFRGCS